MAGDKHQPEERPLGRHRIRLVDRYVSFGTSAGRTNTYVLIYEPATIPVPVPVLRFDHMGSEPSGSGTIQRFLVERRMPHITERGLAMVHAALALASSRFADRGQPVKYLRSTFMPREQRLLSLFECASLVLVLAVNEASLVPFVAIEVAYDLFDPDESTAA